MEMDENDPIQYDQWIEDALRNVIRDALTYTANNGLVGDHHFYITFRTNSEAVSIPAHMLAQHPEETTIVLQHQFTDLNVSDDGFSVSLRFSGKPEQLSIPFSEITGFSDPSVNFGLQLKTMELSDDELDELEFPIESLDSNQDLTSSGTAANLADAGINKSAKSSENEVPIKTGEVIALDAFRKK